MTILKPDWPAPSSVQAFYTTRTGGHSEAPFDSFNLAAHVGDNLEAVQQNRSSLKEKLQKYSDDALTFQWLNQVHGTEVHRMQRASACAETADGLTTRTKFQVCAVLTADCLPLLFCDESGSQVAATHAGWRGLASGILSKTVKLFESEPSSVLCFLGPAISQKAFEVGDDVKQAFLGSDIFNAVSKNDSIIDQIFLPKNTASSANSGAKKYYADLYELARVELRSLGLTKVYGGDHCTFNEQDQFCLLYTSPSPRDA